VLIACVDVPAFPLQLLAKREPEWLEHPMAVVDHDKPQGRILWVNERARSMRILPGMRYAAGLSLSRELRAAVVDSHEVAEHVGDITERLRFYTPEVEPSECEPGVFWLNAAGLTRLYPEQRKWVTLVHDELAS
jgi:protein ImuB